MTLPSTATLTSFVALSLAGLTFACSSGDDPEASGKKTSEPAQVSDAFDVPIADLSADFEADFNDGDLLFSTPMRAADGLGPLYTRTSCSSCHEEGIRGPGLVQKMSVVEDDGVTPAEDQSKLEYGHTIHPLLAAGGETPIVAPEDDPSIKVTTRFGPPILGRGYMEAIADSEIERLESEQAERDDTIHGRVNRVVYASEANEDTRYHQHRKGDEVIGRFGLKARVATLDDFSADAFQGDMGITSPLRPEEFPNPDGLTDDDKPGIDVGFDSVNLRATYIRLLAIPERPQSARGAELFEQTLCSVCHAPALHTRADYPVAAFADIDAPVYTDLLLHNMGEALADGLPDGVDGDAGSFDWRTAPLIGVRFNRTYLHDGRGKTVEQAIELHAGAGSEANGSVELFQALPGEDRSTLIEFVEGL